MPRGDGLVHGTLGGYTNYKCRCQPCRDAYAAYCRDYRARNIDRQRAYQRNHNHTPKRVASRQAWRRKNRDHLRALERLRLYGLRPERWDELMEQQGGVCAICHKPNSDGRALHVDHDHETKAVRGLLCGPCNAALGLFDDSAEMLHKAAAYLSPGTPCVGT